MDEPRVPGIDALDIAAERRRRRRRRALEIAAGMVVIAGAATAAHLLLARGADALGHGSGALFGAAGMGSMPQSAARSGLSSVVVNNELAVPIRLRSIRVEQAHHVVMTASAVVPVLRDTHRDWIEFGLEPLPLEDRTNRAEWSQRRPVDGFRIPPHTRDAWQIAFLLEATDPHADADITEVAVTYEAYGLTYTTDMPVGECFSVTAARTCDYTRGDTIAPRREVEFAQKCQRRTQMHGVFRHSYGGSLSTRIRLIRESPTRTQGWSTGASRGGPS